MSTELTALAENLFSAPAPDNKVSAMKSVGLKCRQVHRGRNFSVAAFRPNLDGCGFTNLQFQTSFTLFSAVQKPSGLTLA
ncbi:MAG TPA: hypothetical protein PKL97_01025 [Candidatus Omnitrophota bacterium]|nr:hypothetical protein [Candidatus Omnitrophota bacterium]